MLEDTILEYIMLEMPVEIWIACSLCTFLILTINSVIEKDLLGYNLLEYPLKNQDLVFVFLYCIFGPIGLLTLCGMMCCVFISRNHKYITDIDFAKPFNYVVRKLKKRLNKGIYNDS